MRYTALVGDGDLTVKDEGPAAQGELAERDAEQGRAIVAVPTEQLKLAAARNDCDQPMAVMLDLMQPALAIRRPYAGRYDLKADIGRHTGLAAPGGKLIGIRNKCPDPVRKASPDDRGRLVPSHWIIVNAGANVALTMEGGKEALEKLAREVVALYGGDAPKMLLDRAAVADEYGDNVQAKAWREIAAIAARLCRSL